MLPIVKSNTKKLKGTFFETMIKNENTPMKKFAALFFAALLGGGIAALLMLTFGKTDTKVAYVTPASQAKLTNFPNEIVAHPNFITASAVATPAVVHIKTKSAPKQPKQGRSNDPFFEFFGDRGMEFFNMPRGPVAGAGSGVIVSEDGYILTNNHVIDNADEIEVVLNNRKSYNGRIIGTDPSTDLAVVKIEERNLPFLPYGNSDNVQVGEWVLAVGNPFNLTSTVTAGIVSAKARNIGILSRGMSNSVESFIQTDAAVNPGNSGGALVNVKGELIGINTAIATETGSFSGYSFAIPVNLASKIADDILKFGSVQRGYLGVSIQDLNAEIADKEGIKLNEGVFVADFAAQSAAEKAGIKKGDVIVKVDNEDVKSVPQLQEYISRKRPGDEVNVTVNRNGNEKMFVVKLKGLDVESTVATKPKDQSADLLGADLEIAPKKELSSLNLTHGVKVKSLKSGKLRETGIREGFIITKVDREAVKSPKDVIDRIQNRRDGVLIEGYYPNGQRALYAISF